MEINPGDIVHAEVRKAEQKQDAGLKLEERKGKIYVRKIGGLFQRRNVPVQPGDRLHTINGVDVEDYEGGLDEIKALIKNEVKIWIKFERMGDDVDDSDSEEEEEVASSDEEEETLMIEGPKDSDESDQEEEESENPAEESSGLEPGSEMRLFKLKKKPKLNGTIVRLVKPAKKAGEWKVEILRHHLREVDTGTILSVPVENLKDV